MLRECCFQISDAACSALMISRLLCDGGQRPAASAFAQLSASLATWAPVAPTLARDFTVVCADLRGYGGSSKPKCAADRPNYATSCRLTQCSWRPTAMSPVRIGIGISSRSRPPLERLIAADPDFFYETCLVGWGANFGADLVAEYPALSARSGHDPRLLLGLSRRCQHRSGARRRRYR